MLLGMRMKTFLGDYVWKQALQGTNVNTKFDIFMAVVNFALHRFIWQKEAEEETQMDDKTNWISKEEEVSYVEEIQETGEYHLYEAYERQLNKARNEVVKAKIIFFKISRQHKERSEVTLCMHDV